MPDQVRSFRRNAVHIRLALDVPVVDSGRLQVDGGYLQDEGAIERYKRLSIPVRRALNDGDRASFRQTLDALTTMTGPVADLVGPARRQWDTLQQELASTVTLGGQKVPRRQILAGWLDAAAFYDKLERDRAYDQLIDRWGKAAEGIAAPLCEDAAHTVLMLDEAAAAALGEPVILPPPLKTPPPPPDPKESFWKRWFGERSRKDD